MADQESNADAAIPVDVLRVALRGQYHAALVMLQQAVERCPEDLWNSSAHPNRFWHVAYHALFFTHLYLQPNDAAFQAWEYHREEYQFLGRLPWPPHDAPKIGESYAKAEVLAYGRYCAAMVNDAVDHLDLSAPDCGFWWYQMPKLAHQMVNIRHLQHHAGQLADRLRAAAHVGIDWIGAGDKEKPGE